MCIDISDLATYHIIAFMLVYIQYIVTVCKSYGISDMY